MTDIDLEKLEQLAKAATPGPWAWKHFGRMTEPPVLIANHGRRPVIIADGNTRDISNGILKPMFPGQPNSDYIAAANPETMLALIQRIKKLEAVRYSADLIKDCGAGLGFIGLNEALKACEGGRDVTPYQTESEDLPDKA